MQVMSFRSFSVYAYFRLLTLANLLCLLGLCLVTFFGSLLLVKVSSDDDGGLRSSL